MKKVTLNGQLSEIDGLLKSKKFEQAHIRLRAVEPMVSSKDERAYFCLLLSEAKLNLGHTDIGGLIEEAIYYYRPSSDNANFARIKFLEGWMHRSLGSRDKARESLLESYAGFKRCDDYVGAGRALNQVAYLALITGDYVSTIDNLKRSLNLFELADCDDGIVSVSDNLATTYLVTGSIQEAIQKYSYVNNARIIRRDDFICHCTLGLALCYAMLGNICESLRLILPVRQLSRHLEREHCIYFEFLGWIHNLAGNFREAEKTLQTGLELSLKIAPESSLISQTKRLLADAYLGLKDYNLAQKYAEEALVVAEKISERAEIAACWRVFAQVSLHRGETDKARGWFKKASELYSMISSRYELAVTRYLAALSGLYGDGERAALLYLAKEYFESEDIKPYIEKVNRELEGITGPNHKNSFNSAGNNGFEFVGASPVIAKARKLAENIAGSSMSVLLTGPTGSGKDQLARYIHVCSGRMGKFISVNCAAIPEGMVESELFGYARGAFTGAEREKPGLFEKADKGTFYLNEIADTTPQFQAKLLEVIEARAIRHLGSTELQPLDFRLIAATNQDLEALLKEGRFRRDLYHRLNEVTISLPPLSERMQDLPLLVRYFLEQGGMVFDENGRLEQLGELCLHLAERDWPGNLRELRAEVQRLHHLAGGNLGGMLALVTEAELTERELLLRTLEGTGWNQSAAARELGVTEGTVRYRSKKWGLLKGDRE